MLQGMLNNMMNGLSHIIISDDDINWVESILKDVEFDEQRRYIFKNMDTIDIQAFPGSGKTTILIAKLAILARKWPYSNRGICVLSHTNAAREEIEKRLGNAEVGKMLLRYPHFIGTFHSFFNTFIAIPWLRYRKIKVKIIDSDFVRELRWERIDNNTKIYLLKNHNSYDCCEAVKLPVEVRIKRVGQHTNTYKKVIEIVRSSMCNGEFTFDEMLLIAEKALEEIACLPDIIVYRFPLLFVDEAQDTYYKQWILLDKAFPLAHNYIRQCFGDQNQAIYQSYDNEENCSLFPKSKPLTLPDSKRFGRRIASFANCIAISKDKMEGISSEYKHLDNMNTVFLFDDNNIQAVINEYISLLFSCFSDKELSDLKSGGCHVIGMVHTQKDFNEEHIPRNIKDYWKDYDPSVRKQFPRFLIDYFRIGYRNLFNTGNMNEMVDWIARGIIRYLNKYNNNLISITSNALRALCKELPSQKINKLREELYFLATQSIKNKNDWYGITERIINIANDIFLLSVKKDSFLQWRNDTNTKSSAKHLNSYTYYDAEKNRALTLHFGSIHSVKGQTHLSTLVVETYWHEPNMKSILPYICGCEFNKSIGERNKKRLKCHYVAFTRPKALLCIAIPKKNIDKSQIKALNNIGWRIHDITK